MLRPTTPDAAGRPVELVTFNASLLPISIGPLPIQVQNAMRSVAISQQWRPSAFRSPEYWLRSVLVGIAPLLVAQGPIIVIAWSGFRFSSTAQIVVLFIGMPIAFYLAFVVAPWGLAAEARAACARVAVALGRCASCGYPLHGLRPEPGTACRTCPECRAVWATPSPGGEGDGGG